MPFDVGALNPKTMKQCLNMYIYSMLYACSILVKSTVVLKNMLFDFVQPPLDMSEIVD